jgi:hypothetical protein
MRLFFSIVGKQEVNRFLPDYRQLSDDSRSICYVPI